MSDDVYGWYVDGRCTNCDVARQIAPDLIGQAGGRSTVLRQPRDKAEVNLLHAAAYACHTRSIRHTSQALEPARDPSRCACTARSTCAGTIRRTPRGPTHTWYAARLEI